MCGNGASDNVPRVANTMIIVITVATVATQPWQHQGQDGHRGRHDRSWNVTFVANNNNMLTIMIAVFVMT